MKNIAENILDVVLDKRYSYGASFEQRFNTNIVMVNSGVEKRNANWKDSLQHINISFNNRKEDESNNLMSFYLQTKGPLKGFLFDNLKDNKVTVDQGKANFNGSLQGFPRFALYKEYKAIDLTDSYMKRIFKPKPGTVKIYNKGVLVNWTVNYKDGTVSLPLLSSKNITMISKAVKGIVTSTNHGFLVGQKLYLKDVVGMTELNNKVVTVDSVVDVNNFTINVNTLGFSTFIYTPSKTFAQRYLNGDEIVWFECEFFIPVRFSDDSLIQQYNDYNSVTTQVGIDELRLSENNIETLDIQ